jgi:ribonuclease HII
VKIPTKTLERQVLAQGYGRIIGVDEVGMACLAGPVVVCALAVPPDFYTRPHPKLAGLRDSKMLQPHQRERYAELIMQEPGLTWQIGLCNQTIIDEINIYQASRVAMRNAIAELRSGLFTDPRSDLGPIVLVDGNKEIKGLELPQRAIVGGDRKIWAIAAASILAKVHRDQLMIEYARAYPGYGFEVHKGYPTVTHRAALATLGPCSLHRRSFRL